MENGPFLFENSHGPMFPSPFVNKPREVHRKACTFRESGPQGEAAHRSGTHVDALSASPEDRTARQTDWNRATKLRSRGTCPSTFVKKRPSIHVAVLTMRQRLGELQLSA
jgi:hypothetical protein